MSTLRSPLRPVLSVALSLLTLAGLQACDDPSGPEENATTGQVSFTFPMAPAQEIWDAFYGSVVASDPLLLAEMSGAFPGVTTTAQLRDACLPFLDHLTATLTAADGTEHPVAFDGEAEVTAEMPPGTYTLDVSLPIDLIQSPFVRVYDAAHSEGHFASLHPDSVEAEEEDVLAFRVEGITVALGSTTAVGTLPAPDVTSFLGTSGGDGLAHLELSTFRPTSYVDRIHLTGGHGLEECESIDADSQGNFYVQCGGHVARFDSSPMEYEDSQEIYANPMRARDVAVKHEGAYLYGASTGLSPWTTKLQRFGKQSFDDFGKIDLDKWNYSMGSVDRWAVSSGGYLFARDELGALIIADLGENDAMKFDEISFWEDEDDDGDEDEDRFTYDVAAVHYEYNYAFLAGERRGGSREPGIYKISRNGNLIRTFGHSDNLIPKGGTMAVDRLRNVYAVRRGGTTSGYFGDGSAITVYAKDGDYLGYVDLSAIEDDFDAFYIEDITTNLDDELFVLIQNGNSTSREDYVYKFRLDL